jgi:hypothetical protein
MYRGMRRFSGGRARPDDATATPPARYAFAPRARSSRPRSSTRPRPRCSSRQRTGWHHSSASTKHLRPCRTTTFTRDPSIRRGRRRTASCPFTQRRRRPAAHHFPALPLLQHLDRVIIALPGAILYPAEVGLKAWPHRSSRPVCTSALDVTGSLQRPQAHVPAYFRKTLLMPVHAGARRSVACVLRTQARPRPKLTPDWVHSHLNSVWVRSTPTTRCLCADRACR